MIKKCKAYFELNKTNRLFYQVNPRRDKRYIILWLWLYVYRGKLLKRKRLALGNGLLI